MIEYKYREDFVIEELMEYINSTYVEHYADGEIEATEYIMDKGLGDGHCLGNVIKYASRYGKKNGYNRVDLMKIAHYTIMQIYLHDKENRG
jgi:hypothetical protein